MLRAMGGLLLALVVSLPASADTERRVALIIGNDAYKGMKPLDTAVNDARAMAAELKGLGWETTVKLNAGRREMNGAMADFGEHLAGGAVGLFYFAGHGIEASGQNFLVPVDAVVEREADLTSEAVDAGRLVQAMKAAKNRLNIVILDACRDNPLKGRSGSRGLAVVPASGAGLFLAYAAGPGEKAEDGAKGGNGVFTAELVKALREPGLRIEDVFKKATAGVRTRTAGKQVPWVQASIEGDFYFRPPSAVQPVVRNDSGSGGADKEALFWSSIQGSADPAMYEAYLGQWPNGTFAAIAKAKLESLKGIKIPSLTPPRPIPVQEALDREMVASRKASVREAPEEKANLVASLFEGDSIQVTGRVRDKNWYVVSREGQTVGYVVTDALEEPDAYKARKENGQQRKAAQTNERCRSLLRGQYNDWIRKFPEFGWSFASIRADSESVKRGIADKVGSYVGYSAGYGIYPGSGDHCIDFRPDIHGTKEGAQCLANLLGRPYTVGDCRSDGSPYNIWTR
jgi:hypothetical protein